MKKALVTGGAGFIGSNVVDLLIDNDWEVFVVDNLSTGFEENLNPKAKFYNVDILSDEFDKIWKSNFPKFDTVFHLAALPRVEPSIHNPVESNEQNVTATLKVFNLARLANITDIVFSSSSSVYGDAKNTPTNESELSSPMSPYALQKLVCDQYAELFCKLYGMNITCLRYFNVYGNREPTEGAYVPVIGIWLRQHRQGESLTITGDGEQSRDFINVADVAAVNMQCAEAKLKGWHVFNVGSGQTHSLNHLASLISQDTKYLPPRIEPRHTCADISYINRVVGWLPKHRIEEYISTMR